MGAEETIWLLGIDGESALSTLDALNEALATVLESMNQVVEAASSLSAIDSALSNVSTTTDEAATGIEGLDEAMASLQGQVDEAATSAEELQSVLADSSGPTSFADSLKLITGSIQQLGSNIGGVVVGRLSGFISGIQNVSSTINDAVSGPFSNFIGGIQNIYSSISDTVSGPLNSFVSSVQQIASTIGDTASNAFSNFIGGIQNIYSSVSDAVSGPFSNFISSIQQFGSNISDAVSGPLGSFIDSIQSFASDISEAASGPLADFINGVRSLASNISDTVSGPLGSFISGIQDAASNISDFASKAGGIALSGITSFMGGVSNAAGSVMDFIGNLGYSIMNLQMFAQQAQQVATALLGPAMSAETMQTAFTTLMGSTKGATDEMTKLDAFASKTPFQTMDIDKAAAQLIGFGTNVNDVVPELTSMGDALSAVGRGSSANLDQIVNIFGKIRLSGKLTGADMNQFSNDGINAWAILEKQTGKTQGQLQKMISAGLFPAKDAINDLTTGIEKNPLYAGGMAKQSATTAGLMSTLKSNWDQVLASFGSPILKGLEPVLSNLGNALASPGFKSFASSVGQGIVSVFQGIGNFIGPLAPKFTEIANNVGRFTSAFNSPVFKQVATEIGGDLKNGLTWLINALASKQFGEFMHTVGVGIVNGIKAAIPVVKEIAANVVSFASGIITHVAPIITWWNANWPTISLVLTGVWDVIKGVVQVGLALIKDTIFIVLDLITGKWGQAWTDFKDLLSGAASGLLSILEGLGEFIVGFFVTLWDTLVGHSIIPDMINGIISWFEQLPGRAGNAIQSMWNAAVNLFNGFVTDALNFGSNIVKNIGAGITGALHFVTDAVTGVTKWISDHLPHSPAKVGPLTDLLLQGSLITGQIAEGMIAGMPKLQMALGQITTPISTSLSVNALPSLSAITPVNSSGSNNDQQVQYLAQIAAYLAQMLQLQQQRQSGHTTNNIGVGAINNQALNQLIQSLSGFGYESTSRGVG